MQNKYHWLFLCKYSVNVYSTDYLDVYTFRVHFVVRLLSSNYFFTFPGSKCINVNLNKIWELAPKAFILSGLVRVFLLKIDITFFGILLSSYGILFCLFGDVLNVEENKTSKRHIHWIVLIKNHIEFFISVRKKTLHLQPSSLFNVCLCTVLRNRILQQYQAQ